MAGSGHPRIFGRGGVMDAFAKKQIFNEIQRIASSRWYETRSQIQEFLNTAYIVIEDEGERLKEVVESGGSAVGWVITAARNTLIHNEKDRFSVQGGASSLNETDQDGRPIFDPATVELEFSKLDELRLQLTEYEREFLDFVNENGTAKIAKLWNCSQRTVQSRLQNFVKQVKARLAGATGCQGDLFVFGGAL